MSEVPPFGGLLLYFARSVAVHSSELINWLALVRRIIQIAVPFNYECNNRALESEGEIIDSQSGENETFSPKANKKSESFFSLQLFLDDAILLSEGEKTDFQSRENELFHRRPKKDFFCHQLIFR